MKIPIHIKRTLKCVFAVCVFCAIISALTAGISLRAHRPQPMEESEPIVKFPEANALSADTAKELQDKPETMLPTEPIPEPAVTYDATETETKIWFFLIENGFSEQTAAAIMGNLYAESNLRPNNLQDTYERKLHMTDDEYTAAVNNGTYSQFASDSAGYGIAQWTYSTRKAGLIAFAKETGRPVDDLDMQLEYLVKELRGMKKVMADLESAQTLIEASNVILTQYEKPANQSDENKMRRAAISEHYFFVFTHPITEGENIA